MEPAVSIGIDVIASILSEYAKRIVDKALKGEKLSDWEVGFLLMEAMRRTMETRMASLEESLKARMEALETKLGSRMDALEKRMEALEKRVEVLEKRVESLEADVRALRTSVDSLRDTVLPKTSRGNNSHG